MHACTHARTHIYIVYFLKYIICMPMLKILLASSHLTIKYMNHSKLQPVFSIQNSKM